MSIFDPRPVTTAEVQSYREETGSSISAAKTHFTKKSRQAAFRLLMEHGTTEEKLDWLLARYAEDHGLGGE